MPFTSLQIYALLPKKNCGKCGFPTCLAFALAIAQGRISHEKCPDLSEEARGHLEEASQPPVETVRFGFKERALEVGGEIVVFRHEKTFYHAPPFYLLLSDLLTRPEIEEELGRIRKLRFERMGQIYGIDGLAIKNEKKKGDTFLDSVALSRDFPLLLISEDLELPKEARARIPEQKPILLGMKREDCSRWIGFARERDCVLVIKGKDLQEIDELSQEIQGYGFKEVILYPEVRHMKEALTTFTKDRRMAIEKKYRPFGFPLLGWAGSDMALASNFICKYASIIILETALPQEILPLITLRANIYSDPQKPQVVEPGLYEIGEPGENSPVLVTTNFSLTFHMVKGEIEHSKIPSHLLITDAEGLSVLSAWAAKKFSAEGITRSIRDSGLEGKVRHRKIIIPGYVASLKAILEEKSGWEVVVGPKEANWIPSFLKTTWETRWSR